MAKSPTAKLLFDEYPLVVNPQLAQLIGLNEAIVLQQVHYWVTINEQAGRNLKEGYYWTYNTLREWHAQFPFWSQMTIRRTIKSLENAGYLISGNFNKMRADKTKWYRVAYDLLESMNSPCVQSEQSKCSDRTGHVVALSRPVPETTEETTPETKNTWDAVLEKLKAQVSKSNYRTWLEGTVGYKNGNGIFTIMVKNGFTQDYLMRNQRSLIEKTLLEVTGTTLMLSVVVKE